MPFYQNFDQIKTEQEQARKIAELTKALAQAQEKVRAYEAFIERVANYHVESIKPETMVCCFQYGARSALDR